MEVLALEDPLGETSQDSAHLLVTDFDETIKARNFDLMQLHGVVEAEDGGAVDHCFVFS